MSFHQYTIMLASKKKNIVTNVQGYSLILIEYFGYFMYGEMKMFLCIFIYVTCKCKSAPGK